MSFFDALRSGSWLTADRLRVYPMIVLAVVAIVGVGLAVTARGAVDALGRPLGADFSGVWVAGTEVLRATPARPFDQAAHAAAQAKAFGLPDNFLPWPYPPQFLAVAAALALLPYLAALALWEGTTLALYLGAVWLATVGAPLRRRDILVPALAFPAAAVNAMHGQNGFLSTGLLAVGAILVPRRPLLAGAVLGLLAYKPQLALMWPLALLAGRHWRALAAASTSVLATTAATVIAYGVEPWRAFFSNLSWMRTVVLEQGGLESYKLVSAFAAVRLLGGSLVSAYTAQALLTLGVAAALAWIWSRPFDRRLQLATLAVATLLATPYCVDYDLVLLGPALAALVALGLERGFAPYETSLLALVWAMPLAARGVAMALHLPLGLLCLVALLAVLVGKARRHGDGRAASAYAEGTVAATA